MQGKFKDLSGDYLQAQIEGHLKDSSEGLVVQGPSDESTTATEMWKFGNIKTLIRNVINKYGKMVRDDLQME